MLPKRSQRSQLKIQGGEWVLYIIKQQSIFDLLLPRLLNKIVLSKKIVLICEIFSFMQFNHLIKDFLGPKISPVAWPHPKRLPKT